MLTLIAESAAVPPWLDELVLLAIKFLGTGLMALVGWAVARLGKKWGVEHTAALEERARAAALDALNYADRWARQQSKTPNGNDKMAKALEYVLTLPGNYLLNDHFARLIESQLEAEKKANPIPEMIGTNIQGGPSR